MSAAAYKIIWQRNSSFGVEVTGPDEARRIVAPFKREADAKAWIADEKWKAAMGASKNRPRSPAKLG
jgi:hypothetical protein